MSAPWDGQSHGLRVRRTRWRRPCSDARRRARCLEREELGLASGPAEVQVDSGSLAHVTYGVRLRSCTEDVRKGREVLKADVFPTKRMDEHQREGCVEVIGLD